MADTRQFYSLPKISKRTDVGSLQLKDGPIPKVSDKDVFVKGYASSLSFCDLIVYMANERGTGALDRTLTFPWLRLRLAWQRLKGDKWQEADRVCFIVNGHHQKSSDPDDEEAAFTLGGAWDDILSMHDSGRATYVNALCGLPGHALRPRDSIVAEGTLNVSVFALQLDTAAGAKAGITNSSGDKLDVAKKEIDCVIGPARRGFTALAHGGVVSIGFVGSFSKKVDFMFYTLSKNCVLRGLLVGSREMFKDTDRLIDVHKIKPLVDKVFVFKDAAEACHCQLNQQRIGKVIISVQ
ncbi:hypothetical protein K437DRAFT_265687 [Tilletiaria anomala UBC 951]|uniref:NAD(P)-binding protein n=1 Tax=Tilletiaria anomala (strain ATCC 24038 / CBS 436.72 / UBC 951) TaxID=1037660 RepID=A0A066WIG6_TILAU|nr:uncharacterized protein K437DRAFT_265687 [Tilletiaria anomala UBC 951]KDN53636.1 hypothetical protein K437DRAFT_265687 [Tilletiaria anomala UBC 951]